MSFLSLIFRWLIHVATLVDLKNNFNKEVICIILIQRLGYSPHLGKTEPKEAMSTLADVP
jgi:hypothetical protein